MKILQVINSLGAGGAEKLVLDMGVALSNQGFDVTILLLDGTETPLYKRLKEHQQINVICLEKGRSVYNPLNIFKIRNIIKKFDIVHVHLFPSSYWVAMARFITFNKPYLIFTEHNTTNRRREITLFKYIDRWVYKKYDCIVTISDAVDSSLKEYLGKGFDNFVKIYNGIHLETIKLAEPYTKEALNFNLTDKLIIQVASFTPQKDQNTLIRALNLLPDTYKLILVGQGPLEQACKTLVKQLNLADRVFFYGVRNDVPRLLKSVDVVVLASHYEGLSLSSIEGMASGKPFVASNVPGLTEVVKGAGILFEDNDEHQLAQVIQKLIFDASYYQQTVRRCEERAQQFDINIMVDNYIKLYKNTNKISF